MPLDTAVSPDLPVFADIEAASRRIASEAVRTPLIRVFDRPEGSLFVKAECLQRTGSFKFRGAFNRLSMIPESDRAAGVVACSSGNHAQGVALAARILGMPATIVMPKDSPVIKVDNTRDYGAEVVFYDRANEDREAIAEEIRAARGATFVHPYDDPGIIAGQGTSGLEIVRQLAEMGLKPDAVVVNASGGGLTAGVSLAIEAMAPDCKVHTCEPAGFDDHARSFAVGERLSNPSKSGSVCDGLLADMPGRRTFAINSRTVTSGVAVTDEEALAAVAFAARRLKIVLEPSGAIGLAAVLARKIALEGRTVVVIGTGGNIDDAMLARALGL